MAFWERHPALFFGFVVLLGTAAVFRAPWVCGSIALLLCLSFPNKKYQIGTILLFITAFLTTHLRHPKVTLPEQKAVGTAHFHFEAIQPFASAFHHSLLCRGTADFTAQDGRSYAHLPCQLYLPLNAKLPINHCDYTIHGTLVQKGDFHFVLKPEKKRAWDEIPDTHTTAFLRHKMKKTVKTEVKRHIRDKRAQTLLAALATGEIDERLLSLEFGKIGLQHILAISGFHFALVAWFLRALFRCMLPLKWAYGCLLLALTGYYFFLGDAPSIQRAYLAIALVVFGKFFSLRTSGLNVLGAALLCEIALRPLCVTSLSFQLTFLCTLGILLFYAPVYALCCKAWPERSTEEVAQLSHGQKYGHIFGVLLRKSLAVNLSVTLISLPVLLHLFHRFPLLSLVYNLFFPACICLSMLLLCAALVCTPLLPWVASVLYSIDNTWTSALLYLTTHVPAAFDFVLRTNRMSFTAAVALVTVGVFLSIAFHERTHRLKNLM